MPEKSPQTPTSRGTHGFLTEPINRLFLRGQEVVRRRIRRDGEAVTECLRPLFDHLALCFYDPTLTVDRLTQEGLVDWRVRERFPAEVGVPVMRYLLERKCDLATWLLTESMLQPRHVAALLGYGQNDHHFIRDFKRWTGTSPATFRTAHLPQTGPESSGRLAMSRQRVLSRLGLELPDAEADPVRPGVLLYFPGNAFGEAAVQLIWDVVRLETPSRHFHLLKEKFCVAEPALFEFLSQLSREDGRRDRQRGVGLALLAVATAEAGARLPGGRARYVLALARLGNAHRLAGNFVGAQAAFDHAFGYWSTVEECDKDSHVEAELSFLLGSLRLHERRFAEALELLDCSIAFARETTDVPLLVSPLLQRIALNGYRDQIQAMLPDLDEARSLLDGQATANHFLLFGVHLDSAFAYLELGMYEKSRNSLAAAQAHCDKLDQKPAQHQLQWIAGRLLALSGGDVAAEQCFRHARAGFEILGDHESAALVALELAILCHQQGRSNEVAELVESAVLPVTVMLQLTGEERVAFQLLRSSLEEDAISLYTLIKARKALLLIQRDPARSIS